MIYAFGVFLLAVGGLLFGLFSRTYYLGDGTGHGIYPISFDELFYWAQWAAFWITLASLVTFAFCRWKGASWKLAAPAIALGLCLHFIAYSMPLRPHRFRWVNGALGFKVFVATKRQEREIEARERNMRNAFAGHWINLEGAELLISDDRARFLEAGGATEFGEGSPGIYLMEPPSRVEYEIARCGLRELRSELNSGHDYPLFLFHNHGTGDSIMILLNPGKLLLITPQGSPYLLSRKDRA